MLQPIRRVVTGHDDSGQSTILFDSQATETLEFPGWSGAGSTELWATDETPADANSPADRARPMRHDPESSGTLFRVVHIPPESDQQIDPSAVFDAMGSKNKPDAEETAQHPSMHRTDSVDYLVVISGEMTMLMEDGTRAQLRPGDCIVQQASLHAWVNTTDTPCLLAAVLVDATTPAALD